VIVLVCLESPAPSPASRAALRLATSLGDQAEVVVISAGGAQDCPSFALARQTSGVRRIVHLQDSALTKPDFLTLGIVLAEAARHLQARVVVAGEHSDGEGQGMVPAALAHHLRAPIFAHVQDAVLPATEDGVLQMTIRSGGRLCQVACPLPIVLSTPALEISGVPPSAPSPSSPIVETLTLSQLGVDASRIVPRPNLLGTRVPVPGHSVQSKSFDEAARILLRRR
jgi:electron transfer flavoprotein beta subunit